MLKKPFDEDNYIRQIQTSPCFIWHLAPLPSGVPFKEQQLAALSAAQGILDILPSEMAELAGRIRANMAV